MKKIKILIFTLAFFFISTTAYGFEIIYRDRTKEDLVDGIELITDKCITTSGFLSYNALIVDTSDDSIEFKELRNPENFRKLYTLGNMMLSTKDTVAAVNASFFSHSAGRGENIGVEAKDSDFLYFIDRYNFADKVSASFILEDTKKYFDYISVDASLKNSSNEEIELAGLNMLSVHGMPVIYTNRAFKDSDAVKSLGDIILILVEDGVVKGEIPKNIDLNDNNYIIGIRRDNFSKYEKLIKNGDKLELTYDSNIDVKNLNMAIAGGGILLRDGKYTDEGLTVMPKSRHPRTAMGINEEENKIILLTVDGRGSSIGANNEDLANILKGFGAKNAISFDGGGSTTMVTRDFFTGGYDLINRVSDGAERGVINALGIGLKRDLKDDMLFVRAASPSTFVKNPVSIFVSLTDANGNKKDIDESKLRFSIDNNATIKDAEFFAYEPGIYEVIAIYGDKKAKCEIEVFDDLVDIIVEPKVVAGNAKMTFKGVDKNGYTVTLSPNHLNFNMSDNLGAFNDDVFISNGKEGSVEVSYKGVKEYFYISAEPKEDSLFNFKDMHVSKRVYPENVEGDSYIKGDKLVIDYDFIPSEESQAVYAYIDDALIKNEQKYLSLIGKNIGNEVLLKAVFVDNRGEIYKVDFEFVDGKASSKMPNMAYPINLERIYAVSLKTDSPKSGVFEISDIIGNVANEYNGEIIELMPLDDLRKTSDLKDYKKISFFGTTNRRSKLLDEIVMNQVYQKFNESNIGVFLGDSKIDLTRLSGEAYVLDGNYKHFSKDGISFINMESDNHSFTKADARQFTSLIDTLKSSSDRYVVITGDNSIYDYLDYNYFNEETIFHKILSDFVRLSGKKVFYVNTSSLSSKFKYYEGVRYIELNGLKNKSDKSIKLNESYTFLNFYINDDDLYYDLESLYTDERPRN